MSKVYEMINNKILSLLDQGIIPWRKTWTSSWPQNFKTKKNYRGINTLLLLSQGYSSPYWVTYKQAKEMKGNVKRGEKGTYIIFWSFVEKENNEGETKKLSFLRYYTVFNIEQTDIVLKREVEKDIVECEDILKNMNNSPKIEKGANPSYSPVTDTIYIPPKNSFDSLEEYYSALFHELGHSTGHKKRLNRGIEVPSNLNAEVLTKEEIIAEFTSSFLCSICEISQKTIENQAAYIKGWRDKIAEDKKLLISSASAAQKATDFILGKEEK